MFPVHDGDSAGNCGGAEQFLLRDVPDTATGVEDWCAWEESDNEKEKQRITQRRTRAQRSAEMTS